ncbi:MULTISPECIES: NUDIX domain-containing protein [unclassified Legionella]|uniref:NUDIX domain-containing protein n=1 Tax=unclassified Legionella TaxID=2622702 RepID=UPI0010557F60|nr:MULTISPECIES: NUDIX domain-containing protein [unclassified Legionella]MDI9817894.1 NUDIX domain-containing protein [Legionella sp. PL877]
MKNKIKIIKKKLIHKGYLQLCNYELTIPSLNPEKEYIHLKTREVVHSADSILVLIYVPAIDSFVLCKQFRPGVFFNKTKDDPFILECIAGTIDNNNQPEEIVRKEAREEAGLELNTLQTIAIAYKSPGLMTEKVHIYYAEIKDIPQSGLYGIGDEEIMTYVIQRDKVYQLMDELNILDSATLIALNWFRANKKI